MSESPLLQATSVQKHFGSVVALHDAALDLLPGEVHAIVGDNGAGKSTFIKILSGVLQPDGGEIRIDGAPVAIHNPQAARDLGIETVYQDLALAGHLDAASNLFLGREKLFPPPLGWLGFLDKPAMRRRTEEEMRHLKIGIKSVEQPVLSLSGGQRQAVAVARAVAWGKRIVIMDEPTAALGVKESRKVLELMLDVKKRGLPIILISHNMPHVFEVADRIHIHRLGRRIAIIQPGEYSMSEAVAIMTGAMTIAPQ